MATAAVLSKLLRGGRARATVSLLPAMGRHHGLPEGLVGRVLPRGPTGPLFPSMGAAALASNASFPPHLVRKGYVPGLDALDKEGKKHFRTDGVYMPYDSLCVVRDLNDKIRQVDAHMKSYYSWRGPTALALVAIAMILAMVNGDLEKNKRKKELVELSVSVLEARKVSKKVKARMAALQAD